MESPAVLYHITTPENLALRREFIGLDADVVSLLAELEPWANRVADAVAAELTDHHFQFSATADFFGGQAAGRGVTLEALRDEWQAARAAHWRRIFAEPGGPRPFGVEYFATLLQAGSIYNRINLPVKWYLGRYPAYLDAVRRQLRENPPQIARSPDRRRGRRRRGDAGADPAVAAQAERAIGIVFNYDLQAITDAFYFDTFVTMGVGLAGISAQEMSSATQETSSQSHVLSASLADLAITADRLLGAAEQFSLTDC